MTGPCRPVRRFVALVSTGAAILVLLSVWLGTGAAQAHAVAGFNLRVVRVVPVEGGFDVYYRLNLPLVLGSLLGPQREDGSFAPTPFSTSEALGSGVVVHPIDIAAIEADPSAFARLILEGHTLRADGMVLSGLYRALRVHPRGRVPPFDSAAQAEAATTGPVYPQDGPPIDAASAVADLRAFYAAPDGADRLTIESSLHPGRMGGHETISLLVYEEPGTVTAGRQVRGLLVEPEPLFETATRTFLDTVLLGVQHILEGLDHVLFVLCLAIGAQGFGALAARVTAFTIGHSLTLGLGLYGLVPTVPWFVPAVEMAIAATIIYAGLTATRTGGLPLVTLAAIVAIGLLHGFGFSFVLRDLVGESADHLLLRLAAFNIGVEIGQLLIVAAAFGALALVRRRDADRHRRIVAHVATGAIWVSAVWMIERAPALVGALQS